MAKSPPTISALNLYLQSIRRHPLLTREEEGRLALEYQATRDPKVARRLVEGNLRLVVALAFDHARGDERVLDLIQEGNLALVRAVERFDTAREATLATYASHWIRAYMLNFLINNRCLVRVGTTTASRRLFWCLSKARRAAAAQGVEDGEINRVIAEQLELPEHEVASMWTSLGAGEVSTSLPVGRAMSSEAQATLGDRLEDERPLPDAAAERQQFKGALSAALVAFDDTLTDARDRVIFRGRLLRDEPESLREIGRSLGISREWVRQLEALLLARLRVHLALSLGDAVPAVPVDRAEKRAAA